VPRALLAIVSAVVASVRAMSAWTALVEATSALIALRRSTSTTMRENESAARATPSSMRCVVSRIVSAEEDDSLRAVCTALTMAAIMAAASAVAAASALISLATTEKPRPCSPARAASIAALSDRSFVFAAT
jgi:hypothetical protein